MKKLFKDGLALLIGLFSFVGAYAQGMQQLPPMPVDTAVRVGVLPNGLTYYIRHNETPKGQADFYIAQKVGSILEEDNQRGLAHFLEHMCFNGTENFPGKNMINWLESVGVKFGQNLNAYTSIDETVYNISSVPVARKSVQDSCLLILHDWACALTLDPEEINAERGVIHEEWRRSMVGQMRIVEEQLPKIYPNNKYGYRLPIGTMEVVDNFAPEVLVDYYHTWYRPDQQGVIVVGDIDVDYIEGKIKELFGPIAMPENAKERYYVPVEDTPGTIYAIGKDPEQQMAMASLMIKTDKLVPRELRNTQLAYAMDYLTSIISSMFNARLQDIANTPDSPFAYAHMSIGNFLLSNTKDAIDLTIIGKDSDIRPAIEAVYRELLRASRGGFTQSEFDRANAELRSRYQKLYDGRNTTRSEAYVKEYVRSFIDNNPIPGIEVDKQIFDMLSQAVPLEQVNAVIAQLVTPDNRVLLACLPEMEGYVIPTEEEMAAVFAAVDAEDIEPYAEEVRTDPLIPQLPQPGTITAENHNEQWDATEYTLSNGVKVLVKPTKFKDNEIVFMADAKGGYSIASDEIAPSITFLPMSVSTHGLGAYSNSDLTKYLKGTQASLDYQIETYNRGFYGKSTRSDLPTLMELIYANFTEFTIVPEEFAATQALYKSVLANQSSTPEYVHGKLVNDNIYKAPAEDQLTAEIVDAADCKTTVDFVKSLLANAKDYTFVFVGDIDLDAFKPLMEQYIATLPVDGKSIEYKTNPDYEFSTVSGTVTDSMPMATDQTYAFYLYNANMPYTAANRNLISIVGQIMTNRLVNKVREEMGATYSIYAGGMMTRTADQNVGLQINFPMKPEMSDEVIAAIDTIVNDMAANVTADELNSIKEFMVKNAVAGLEENNAWANGILGWTLNGVDTFNNIADVINAITVEDVMNFWKGVLTNGSHHLIMLTPAAK